MYKKTTLKNGLRVITSRMPHMESVSIGVWIGVGSRYEEKKLSGISHLTEHMLFKGTASRTHTMLKEAIEGVGGNFNGFTSEEVTCYLVKVPAAHTELGLDILSDMALNPKLETSELEKEKCVISEEIKMYADQPAHRVFDILVESMWPNHALGRPITGYINTVKAFTRKDLTDFMAGYYRPANMSVVACGKIDRKKIIAFAKKTFSAHSAKRSFRHDSVKKIHKESHVKVFYKDTKQTRVAFGFHSIHRTHRLKYAVRLMDIILGANMSSRLFEGLREKKALCYDIGSSLKDYKDTGSFFITAGVDNNKLLEASGEIIRELADIKKNFVTPNELRRAKEYAKGQLLLGLEDTASRMLWLGDRIMTTGRAPSTEELLRNIDKVEAADIAKATNIIFDRKNLNFATVGPARKSVKKKLEEVLEL